MTAWASATLPPRVATFQKDFITKYMDPTESYERLDGLAAQFPDIAEIVPLPHKTDGYQRPAMAMMAGTTASGSNPNATNAPLAVQLFSKAMGHLGGNLITAEFKAPGVPNAPLTVQVTDMDIVVNLATNAEGAPTSTAAQVVAAINASAPASALVTAHTYLNNAGAGIVPARAKVQLSDFLAAPAHVQKGPFDMRVLRIGKQRDGTKTGVFIYCQQHAREWVTPITCVETAERLVRNYATDPTTKEYVDNLDIFILPSVNPDGGHYAFYDGSVQRKNMKNYCPMGANGSGIGSRSILGRRPQPQQQRRHVLRRLLRRRLELHQRDLRRPVRGLRARDQERAVGRRHVPEDQVRDQHPHARRLLHVGAGRVHLAGPRDAAGAEHRRRELLLRRGGHDPVAHQVVAEHGDPAAAHGPDRRRALLGRRQLGRRPVLPQGHHRLLVRGRRPAHHGQPDDGRDLARERRLPAVLRRGRHGRRAGQLPDQRLLVNEGHDSAMEFADGNYGLIQGALEYSRDTAAPEVEIDYSAERTTGPPINYRFNWINEPSVIHYTTDGSTPTPNSPTYNNQGPRRPGEVLTLDRLGIHDIKWIAVDVKGNQSAVKSKRFLIGPEQSVGGTVPATLALSLGTPAAFGAFTPGIGKDYTASTTATVISTAGSGALSVADASAVNTGHLMNGSFFLPQKLSVSATSPGGLGAAGGPVGGSASPTSLLTYGGPVTNDPVAVTFKQSIAATDALRTGAYTKTLTFTLSTTNP